MSEEGSSPGSTPGVDGPQTPEQAPMERDVPDPIREDPNSQPSKEPTGWQRWYQQLKPILGYLPTGTHEEDTERDGLLSYSKENHAMILGLAIGMTFATRGDMQLVMMLIDTALGVGRVQQQFSETVELQIVKEPWYALSGAALGYVAMHVAQTGALPPLPA